MTWVMPSGKRSPGLPELVDKTVPPELSVAVGAVQVTPVLVVPNGTDRVISKGQLLITGAETSEGIDQFTRYSIFLIFLGYKLHLYIQYLLELE